MKEFPNILVISAGMFIIAYRIVMFIVVIFSAGGYGHIPIPLIKGTLNYTEPKLGNLS